MTKVELYAHATNIRACDIFGHFDAFSTAHPAHTTARCMRFRFYPLSSTFPSQYVFDETAQRISMDSRAKRIEMYAFSNENTLVCLEP